MASGLCVPHQQAAHMAAPTEGQNIKKNLANGEPSTHGAKRTFTNRQGAAGPITLSEARIPRLRDRNANINCKTCCKTACG